jgi:Ca-activated chloride channel family protein
MSDFHFLRPWWLLAFIPLVWIGFWLARRRRDDGDWRALCDPELLPYILIHDGGGRGARFGLTLWALGGALAILALAGPAWERLPTPAFRNDAALVIALDLSRIMNAADLKPSRLERARYKIEDILNQRRDGLTALLVYSGDAYTVTPLTDDTATIKAQLSALSSDLMPTQGSRADLALEQAARLLKQSGSARGDVLLITNGVDLGKAERVAEQLHGDGYRVSVLGAGGEEGAPVPLPEGGFLQDTKGEIVVSRLATPALRRLAERGGGIYRTLTADGSDVTALKAYFERSGLARPEAGMEAGVQVTQWRERGPWLLLILLPIAALAFRRGLLVAAFVLLIPWPQPARALEWRDLWQTPDQRASESFAKGEHAQAAKTFTNPEWQAAARYRTGDYQGAAESLRGFDHADAHYNRGNALAKLGRYPEAVTAYDQALTRDPGHEDARHNKALVEKALQERQKEQPQSSQGDGQEQAPQKVADGEQGKDGQDADSKPGKQEDRKTAGSPEHAPEQPDDAGERSAEQRDAGGKDEEPAVPGATERTAKAPKDAAEAYAEPREREERQANEQWLRRIPDDPGGLLRRKFYYQYQQRQGRNPP